jgi:hypothetical protein
VKYIKKHLIVQKLYYLSEEFIDIEKNGETHQYQGKLIHLLQSAVGSNSYEAYKRYAEGIYNLPPINLRDLINFRKKKISTFD